MSTDYTVELREAGGISGILTLVDSLVPFQDSWTPNDFSQWASQGGAVSSWSTGGALLTGPVGVNSIVLDGFTKDVEAGSTGTGAKNYEDGSFPMGGLTWRCVGKA